MIYELLFLVAIGSLAAWLGLCASGDTRLDARTRARLDRYCTRRPGPH